MPSSRRPLPSRVYWGRRLLVVGMVVVFISAGFLLMRLGGAPTQPVATTQGLSLSPSSTPSPADSSTTPKRSGKKKAKKAAQVTQTPQGPCDVASLVVVPLVPDSSVAETRVTIGLSFTTTASAPCTFHVSSDSVVARIIHGTTRIWSTQDCPAVLPDQVITVGPHTPGITRLDWDGRKSSTGCPDKAKYAKPGNYLVQAAAYGSDAGQMKFELAAPPSPTATPTATATATGKGSGN